jgi:hypothetical protein
LLSLFSCLIIRENNESKSYNNTSKYV